MISLIEELALLRRLLYTTFFTLVFSAASGVTSGVLTMLIALAIFGASFVLQHLIFNRILRAITPQHRVLAIYLWMIYAVAFCVIGMYLVVSVDWVQTEHIIAKGSEWRVTIFITGSSMFTSGSCAWRAFERHGGLGRRSKTIA